MTMIVKSTCKFCGIEYARLRSGRWFRGTKDTRERSATLCPDCYEKVMNEIKAWNQIHTGKDLSFLANALFRKRMAAQSVLAVLKTLDETCLACFGGLDREDEMIQKRREGCSCKETP